MQCNSCELQFNQRPEDRHELGHNLCDPCYFEIHGPSGDGPSCDQINEVKSGY